MRPARSSLALALGGNHSRSPRALGLTGRTANAGKSRVATNPMNANPTNNEWLETDGRGGFASGTSTGIRTRRYHALLLTATTPPTGRMVLVNGFDAWVELDGKSISLSSQCFAPGVIGGDGASRIESFTHQPWPRWIFKLDDDSRIQMELFVARGEAMTCITWKLLGRPRDAQLYVRPFLSGRDYHALHKANSAFRFETEMHPGRVTWQPYGDVPGVTALTNGLFEPEPHWYLNFLYTEEQARGLDCTEDLAAPGVFSWTLAGQEAVLVLSTREAAAHISDHATPLELASRLRERELARRAQFASPLHAAADAYIV